MTDKKTETKPAEEHGTDAAGKVNKNLDAEGHAISDQEGAAARMATMQPKSRPDAVGQLETVSAKKKG